MNVKDYAYVAAIAKQGNLSKAAERLHITPGALSKFLLRLEDSLGVPLFYRLGVSLSPTPVGEHYLKVAEQILSLDEQLTHDIEDMVNSGGAAVRLATPRGISPFIMSVLLPEFYEKRRNDQLIYERGSSSLLIKDLEDGKLDIVLGYASEEHPSLSYQKLAHVSMVLAVPGDSSLLKQAKKIPTSPYPVLGDSSWLEESYICLSNQTHSGLMAENFFAEKGKRPPVRLYVRDTSMALSAVENGLGNTLLLALPHTDRLVHYLMVPELSQEGADIYAITRRGETPKDAICCIIQIAEKYYARLDG
ncbi:MAG: LysR family transcriptional regulator [Blautia sp.]|nr:LysR family transcriptional regulator [Blautia sp.]